jgi:DNA-binding transcriptional MerR regulator
MTDGNLTISELARKAGVSVRTIRYYINQGLLPAPEMRGAYTIYDEHYIDLLRLIGFLKQAHFPLKKIRSLVAGLSHGEVRRLLREYEEPLEIQSPSRAAARSAPQPKGEDLSSAAEYLAQLIEAQNAEKPWQQAYLSAQAPQTMLPDRRTLEGAAPRRGRPPLQDAPPAAATSAARSWLRLRLAPGVELHLREDLLADRQAQITELVELAHRLF